MRSKAWSRAHGPRLLGHAAAWRCATRSRRGARALRSQPKPSTRVPDPLPLLPTTLVGSYPQPAWLVDREKLRTRLPPRVRAKEVWRVPEELLEEAQDDAT